MLIDLAKFEVGSKLISRTTTARTEKDLDAYAQASGDLNPLHLDKSFAQKAGFDDRVVHGMLNMALLANFLTENFVEENIISYSARFEGVLLIGEETADSIHLLERFDDHVVLELLSVNPVNKPIVRGRAKIKSIS